jgi:NitT/TauT family transport system ATP-binding protein
MGSESMLSLRSVSKTYVTEQGSNGLALQSVDLDVAKGEFVSLIGPSGCGKTTLLKIAAGLLAASEGQVYFDGSAGTPPPKTMGVVFQSPSLLPWRTVLGNVLFPAVIHRADLARLKPRAHELLEMLNLAGSESKYPWELSGGMQQRASIARSLLLEPDVIFMDEPFGALDAMTREKLNTDVQELHLRNDTTVLFVTHNIPESIFLSDRIVALSSSPGRVSDIIEVNLPRPRTEESYTSDAFRALERRIREAFHVAVGGARR